MRKGLLLPVPSVGVVVTPHCTGEEDEARVSAAERTEGWLNHKSEKEAGIRRVSRRDMRVL